MPAATQFGLKSSVKSRKLSTAGESEALCRTNIAIFHFTAGCSSGRNASPKPCTSGSAIEGQITAPCRTRSIVIAPLFLIVNAKASFKNLQELIAYGKSQPDGLTFASPGAGSQPHLAAELLLRDAGVKGLNVQYRGDAMAYTELLAGRVDATLTAISTALPHIQSGEFRVLGVASAARSDIYPAAATLREQGFANVVASGWFGFMAPSATPQPIVDRMQQEINRALANPEVKQKLLVQGLEARPGTAAEFGKFVDDETRKWGELIRATGLKGE
jgi:tripartite-type tricarboxylate transporter receptor subunit TctC